MEQHLRLFFDKLYFLAQRFVGTPKWELKVAIFCFLAVVFFAFPSLEFLTPGHLTWHVVLNQIDHPFVQYLADSPELHESKRTFRLTVPIIFGLINVKSIAAIYVTQLLATVFFFYLVTCVSYKILDERVSALLISLSFALMYAGQMGVVDTNAKFDGIAVTFLLAAMANRNPILIFLSVTVAAWTDERAVIASSMVFLWWKVQAIEADKKFSLKRMLLPDVQSIFVILALGMYLAGRFYLSTHYGLIAVKGAIGMSVLVKQFNMVLFGLWTGFEGLWIIVFLALTALIYSRQYLLVGLMVATGMCSIVVALSVLDVTRSMVYLAPLLFIALQAMSGFFSKEFIRRTLLLCFFVCLLVPTYFGEGAFRIEGNNPAIFKLLGWGVNLLQV